VNLILFEQAETARPLPATDPRARHLRDVLRRQTGDGFDCGIIHGPRGRARIERIDGAGLHLDFVWAETPAPPPAIALLIGLPRPQTARKILQECTAHGVAALHFFGSEKGESSYASSQLWTSGEVRRHLIAGAAQAFCTRLPDCSLAESLADALTTASPTGTRVALDNYEAPASLAALAPAGLPAVLVVGSERGWSARERDLLRAHGFTLAHLGGRVLRTETACVCGLTLLKARLGLL
jgi:RsmE family RNA methyltransferase